MGTLISQNVSPSQLQQEQLDRARQFEILELNHVTTT